MKLIKSLKDQEDCMWRNIGIPAVKLDMRPAVDRGRRRKKKRKCRADYTLRHYEAWISLRRAVCFRGCMWHFVSCGAETAWVMGGLIDEGIAHNHPPVCTIPPISICPQSKSLGGCWVRARCCDQFFWRAAALSIQIWTSVRSAASPPHRYTSFFLEEPGNSPVWT